MVQVVRDLAVVDGVDEAALGVAVRYPVLHLRDLNLAGAFLVVLRPGLPRVEGAPLGRLAVADGPEVDGKIAVVDDASLASGGRGGSESGEGERSVVHLGGFEGLL